MRKTFFVMFFCGLACSLYAQEPKEKDRHGSWQVNKEFDENGNLIRYDSVYRYTSDQEIEGFNQEMIDSLFKGIPEMLRPIGQDMEAFFRNDPFFSEIFGVNGPRKTYSMAELEQMLRNDSLWIDQSDIDELSKEFERLHNEFLKQLHGQSKVPEKERDTIK